MNLSNPQNPVPRAVITCILGLTAWWFVLKPASLYILFLISYLPLDILIGPADLRAVNINSQSGQWLFNVALNIDAKDPDTGKMQHASSMEVGATPDEVAFFVSGWVVFLALSFAVGGFSRKKWLATLKGFSAQLGVSVLALAAYAYVNAFGSVYADLGTRPGAVWFLKWVYHVDYLVVPFFAPFLIALIVHPEWRAYFLPGMPQTAASPKR
ncbi:MAG: hypothetical protein RL328_50 [Acidobacteriota bacterium]|jgi:hypothetical protein